MTHSNASRRTRRGSTTHSPWRRAARLAVLVAALGFPVSGQVRSGAEFQVNAHTAGRQTAPAATGDGAGNFAIVWTSGEYGSASQDGSGPGVVGQRFGAADARVGTEFQANTYTTEGQRSPAVASDPSGGFVVVWTSSSYQFPTDTQDGDGGGVFAQRFDATGTKLAAEIQVNQHTQQDQDAAAVARDATGNFVVVWRSDDSGAPGPNDDTSGIFGRRYDGNGAPLGDEFLVNAYTTGSQTSPAVASDSDGGFVVVWSSVDGDTGPARDHFGIFGRRFDASTAPLADEFQVNTAEGAYEIQPSVARAPQGSFVVAWAGVCYLPSCPDQSHNVLARRFDAAGTALGPEFVVNTFTMGTQNYPAVAVDALGAFLVAWTSDLDPAAGPDGSESGVFGRLFDAAGAPSSGEFQVNVHTTGDQAFPTVAAAAPNDFVVAWVSYDYGGYPQDGSGSGVFARRFSVAPAGCAAPADCDDGDACTLDGCAAGQCSHTAAPDCQACATAAECASGCRIVPDQCVENRCVVGDACPRVTVPSASPKGADGLAQVTVVVPAAAATATLKAKVKGTIAPPGAGGGCGQGKKVTKKAGAKLRGAGTTVLPVRLSKLGKRCLASTGALPVRLAVTIRAKKTKVTELSIARTWVP